MALGQRGRRAPRGKLESNPSITDLSYTAWVDTRWGLCDTDIVMLSHVAMGHHETIKTSL